MKPAEFRAMSDEQLSSDAQGNRQEPVPSAFPVGHRASGDAQRDPQGQAGRRPHQDHPARSDELAARESRTRPRERRRPWLKQRKRDEPATAAAPRRNRRRHQRQDEQDPPRRDSAAGQASALRQVHQVGGRSATSTTRTTSRALGDTVEIMETRPLSKTKYWRLVRVVVKAPAMPTHHAQRPASRTATTAS